MLLVRTDKDEAQRLLRPAQGGNVTPLDGKVWIHAQLLQCLIIREEAPLQSRLCKQAPSFLQDLLCMLVSAITREKLWKGNDTFQSSIPRALSFSASFESPPWTFALHSTHGICLPGK